MLVRGPYPVAAGAPATMRTAVAGSMAGKAAEMATLLALATVVPRALGPTAYGRFALPLTVVTLGSLAMTLGGPAVLARYVPAVAPAERPAMARALGWRLAKGRLFQLGAAGVVLALVLGSGRSDLAVLDAALVAGALVLNVVATLVLQIGLGLGRTGPWSLRYPLQNAVLIAAVLVLHDSAGAVGGLWALVAAGLTAVAFALAALRHELRELLAAPATDLPEGALRFGVLSAAGAALVQASHRGGVLAVALLGGGTVAVGHTALAIGIALGVSYAVLQAFTVSLPHLAGAGDARQGEAALRRLAALLLVPLAVAGVAAAVAIDRLVPLVFGERYETAVDAFGPAIALVVLAPLASLLVQAAALRLRPEASLAMGAAAFGGFLVTAGFAVPAAGAAGGTAAAPVGTALAILVGLRLLPGAAGPRLVVATAATAALVAAIAW